MALFAISDLHLSFYKHKPMDVFGSNWFEHPKKIRENWLKKITEKDTVLIPGDISWGKNYEELYPDMEFIKGLTGKKIFIMGNHDYWWNSTSRLNGMYGKDDMLFLKNNYTVYDDWAICGTRGWICPNDIYYTPHDEKIYKREVKRLRLSLESAVGAGLEKIIVIFHFPPTNDKKENSLFIDVLKEYNVKKVFYGHLHSKECFDFSFKGVVDDIEYNLISADYLDFSPKEVNL